MNLREVEVLGKHESPECLLCSKTDGICDECKKGRERPCWNKFLVEWMKTTKPHKYAVFQNKMILHASVAFYKKFPYAEDFGYKSKEEWLKEHPDFGK